MPGEWKLVPVEPTREMWAAMGTAVVHLMQRNNLNHDAISEAVFRAMLNAAPIGEEGEGKGWQPIETAPKAKVVLVRTGEGVPTVAYQTDNGEPFMETWRYAGSPARGEQLWSWPTEWMPLPGNQEERRKPEAGARTCTCHPDDNPPKPCAGKYALSECLSPPSPTVGLREEIARIIDPQAFEPGFGWKRKASARKKADAILCRIGFGIPGPVDPSGAQPQAADHAGVLEPPASVSSWRAVPVEPTYEMVRAACEDCADSDEGPFSSLGDLLDFSGENALHIVVRSALKAAIAAAPTDPSARPASPCSQEGG